MFGEEKVMYDSSSKSLFGLEERVNGVISYIDKDINDILNSKMRIINPDI